VIRAAITNAAAAWAGLMPRPAKSDELRIETMGMATSPMPTARRSRSGNRKSPADSAPTTTPTPISRKRPVGTPRSKVSSFHSSGEALMKMERRLMAGAMTVSAERKRLMIRPALAPLSRHQSTGGLLWLAAARCAAR
jgi:hypothetical protein